MGLTWWKWVQGPLAGNGCLLPRNSQEHSMSPDLCSETKQRFTVGQELPKCGVCDPVSEMMVAVTVPPFICDREKWKAGWWLLGDSFQVLASLRRDGQPWWFPIFSTESPTSRSNRQHSVTPLWLYSWWWLTWTQRKPQSTWGIDMNVNHSPTPVTSERLIMVCLDPSRNETGLHKRLPYKA